jgi:hypothetical protein
VIACGIVASFPAHAAPPTAGYPEAVVQWGVQKGETCEDVAKALYGSASHASLVLRYNRVACRAGTPLPEGATLVMPEKVTRVADASIRSMNPDVRAREAGASWSPASPGMPLHSSANVSTLEKGRADLEFIDRTRVFLAPNTLVVIYGTAARTQVSRLPPARVELESGELKAGLAALRGDAVEVAVKGGGRVSASSRDAVVERKGERTTVAVFDGKAAVASGGKTVDVPTNHGTRFVGAAPPSPPRPLPPAPAWEGAAADGLVLAAKDGGAVVAAWAGVPKAAAYRVELARDAGFGDLVVREEVPARIRSFRAEKLPPGEYHLHVRAIDDEDYLGVAAARDVRVVAATIEGGTLGAGEITASRYAELVLPSAAELEVSLDGGAFVPAPPRLDLRKSAPKSLAVRARGSLAATTLALRYVEAAADVEARPGDAGALAVTARLRGLDGVDVGARVRPSLRVRRGASVASVALAPGAGGAWVASIPAGPIAPDRLDVVDDRGALLGARDLAPPPPPPAPLAAPERLLRIGAAAPAWPLSGASDVPWLAPTAPNQVVAGLGATGAGSAAGAAAELRASGALGPVGFDGALRTLASSGSAAGASAWVGSRVRVLRLGVGALELAPALRVGLPIAEASPPTRLEPSLAVGGAPGAFSWLVDLGARVRARGDGGAGGAPPSQGFLLAGATLEPAPWARLHLVVDGHVVHRDGGGSGGLGGLAGGVELGRALFGALSLRAAPWVDAGEGHVSAFVGLGVREPRP